MSPIPVDDDSRYDEVFSNLRAASTGRSGSRLKKAAWAVSSRDSSRRDRAVATLNVDLGPRPVQLTDSVATGLPLVSNGYLGADIIRLGKGERFRPHVHIGDHLLLAIGGEGTVTFGGRIYPVFAGEIYLVPGGIPHAVGAISDHVLLSIGAPHRAIDAFDRMQAVSYEEIVSEPGDMECLLCGLTSQGVARLHEHGCQHCPCPDCVRISRKS
jgi:quercetin dioxygenase-like cupin family protein